LATPSGIFIMIMDDILGMSLSDITDNDFPFETEIEEAKNMDMAIPDINLNLEELEFDFEDMQNFGPWIEADIDVNNIEPEPTKHEALSERLNFKDLEIEEAVRYDCMWSSYNEFNADTSSSKVKDSKSSTPLKSATNNTVTSSSPNLNLSNSFYDSLLNSFETPSCTESDNTSERSSDMDTDTEDSEEASSDKAQIYTNMRDIENKNLDRESSIRLFASMDHCYNISSTQLDNEKFLTQSPSGPLTPPMSSDDEETSDKHRTNFKFDQKTSSSQNNKNKLSFIRTKASNGGANNIKSSQSLLKKSYTKSSPEAKFSFKLNLNDTKSRSLLKQRIQKVKIIKAPGVKGDKQKTKGDKANKVQSAIRKRKERSLKMQEGEAREMHNQMERQRRNELKLSFDKLKTVLPELATSDKASKQQILDKAVDAVNMFKSTEASLAQRRNNLSKSNALLQEKLRLLKQDILKSDKYNMGIDKW